MDIEEILLNYSYSENSDLFTIARDTTVENLNIGSINIKKYINEFWTSRQRQANSLHEISYRACFKPQLPRFFIERLSKLGDTIYDPFTGRGTTVVEAALLGRNVISNDINPLSRILCEPRLHIPNIQELVTRLDSIKIYKSINSDIDLSMFYHIDTLKELLSLRVYLLNRTENNSLDSVDRWIQMVATNRLTGHSKGFFSVYTLPPNQAVSQERQKKINIQRDQIPEYRNTKKIILKKSKDLLKDLSNVHIETLRNAGNNSIFLSKDARNTDEIFDDCVTLTITSPPFLDIVQYASDNWLRCWFNNIDAEKIGVIITMAKSIAEWNTIMQDVFNELYRITKRGGFVAFEVGEVRNGKVNLDEYVVRIGMNSGFICIGIMINEQMFSKTSNIWGVSNNNKGTNTNRIVIFQKK